MPPYPRASHPLNRLPKAEHLRNDRGAGDLVVAQVAGPDINLDAGVGRRVGAGEVDALRDGAAAAGDVNLLHIVSHH